MSWNMTTPLRFPLPEKLAGYPACFANMALVRPSPDRLVLRYSWGLRITLWVLGALTFLAGAMIPEDARILAWLICGAGLVFFRFTGLDGGLLLVWLLWCAFLGPWGNPGNPQAWFYTQAIFALGGFFLFSRSVRFDRSKNLVTVQTLFTRRSRALDEVVGLQLIRGYFYEMDRDGDDVQGYHTYQLNLVLRGEGELRVNLSHHGDRRWTRYAGLRLARFLRVPLLDQDSDS